MKEFEKQFNKTYPLPRTMERGPIGRDFKNGCEKMWRAALEWAKQTMIDNADCETPTFFDIKKELEDEN